MKSDIRIKNKIPTLYIDDCPTAATAYTTYFEERSAYREFIAAGYDLFFVNASFTTLPINSEVTGFSPFRVGIFENPAQEDYTEFENAVNKILEACPQARIFPRINISMPKQWVDDHPNETVRTTKGGCRECLFSENFRRDGAALLRRFIKHVQKAPYAENLAGWQICGGMTQEWFHHDLFGSLSPAAAKPYAEWHRKNYGTEMPLPSREEFLYRDDGVYVGENARHYAEFCNIAVAETIEFFAKTVKEETDYTQVVGTFYGYSLEVTSPLFGTHAVRKVIDSPHIDFFCSPNSYADARKLGADWPDMMAVDSIRSHGKLCFIECDIRTYLTVPVQKARPNEYPDGIYSPTENGKATVWAGPKTAALSREALRKAFAHQLVKGAGIWWFDMFGGWYDAPLLMKAIAEMKTIYETTVSDPKEDPLPESEVVLFVDETAYTYFCLNTAEPRVPYQARIVLSTSGVPYRIFLVEDADIALKNCKAAIFSSVYDSENGKRAKELCEKRKIPYRCLPIDPSCQDETIDRTVEELRSFYEHAHIFRYMESNDILYVGNGFVALHAAEPGNKEIRLPCVCEVETIFGIGCEKQKTDCIRFAVCKYETVLFSVRKAD